MSATNQQITAELIALMAASLKLSEHYIPKVNHGASFLDANAIAALNEFEQALSAFKQKEASNG